MPEMMHQSHRPVAGDGLFGLALGGGVHRHQAQFEGMVDHDPGCAEIALDRPDIQIAGALNSKITQAIVGCLFESEEENLSPIIINLLRPPMHDALLRLKEKFSKK